MMTCIRPELVDLAAINHESGLDQKQLEKLPFGYTGIWWYAQHPNHYRSDGTGPNRRLGELLLLSWSDQVAELIKYLKTDDSIQRLQHEFAARAEHPLKN